MGNPGSNLYFPSFPHSRTSATIRHLPKKNVRDIGDIVDAAIHNASYPDFAILHDNHDYLRRLHEFRRTLSEILYDNANSDLAFSLRNSMTELTKELRNSTYKSYKVLGYREDLIAAVVVDQLYNLYTGEFSKSSADMSPAAFLGFANRKLKGYLTDLKEAESQERETTAQLSAKTILDTLTDSYNKQGQTFWVSSHGSWGPRTANPNYFGVDPNQTLEPNDRVRDAYFPNIPNGNHPVLFVSLLPTHKDYKLLITPHILNLFFQHLDQAINNGYSIVYGFGRGICIYDKETGNELLLFSERKLKDAEKDALVPYRIPSFARYSPLYSIDQILGLTVAEVVQQISLAMYDLQVRRAIEKIEKNPAIPSAESQQALERVA